MTFIVPVMEAILQPGDVVAYKYFKDIHMAIIQKSQKHRYVIRHQWDRRYQWVESAVHRQHIIGMWRDYVEGKLCTH